MLSGLYQVLSGNLQFLRKLVTLKRYVPFFQSNPAAKTHQAVSPWTIPLLPAKANIMEKENQGRK
jgi:hypothetical protein